MKNKTQSRLMTLIRFFISRLTFMTIALYQSSIKRWGLPTQLMNHFIVVLIVLTIPHAMGRAETPRLHKQEEPVTVRPHQNDRQSTSTPGIRSERVMLIPLFPTQTSPFQPHRHSVQSDRLSVQHKTMDLSQDPTDDSLILPELNLHRLKSQRISELKFKLDQLGILLDDSPNEFPDEFPFDLSPMLDSDHEANPENGSSIDASMMKERAVEIVPTPQVPPQELNSQEPNPQELTPHQVNSPDFPPPDFDSPVAPSGTHENSKQNVLPESPSLDSNLTEDGHSALDSSFPVQQRQNNGETSPKLQHQTNSPTPADPPPASSKQGLVRIREPDPVTGSSEAAVPVNGPIDRFALANSLFGAGDFEACLTVINNIDSATLIREDQIWLNYLQACCHRQGGRLDQARMYYRRVTAEPDGEWIKVHARWWLDNLDAKTQLSAELSQLQQTLKSWENEIDALTTSKP